MTEQEYLKQVGMEFKLERIRQELTIERLAELSKVHKMTVISVEKAQECGRLTTLKKIADGLGKPLSQFV
jgi:transcriptional regulator with XRE-family HTH domain